MKNILKNPLACAVLITAAAASSAFAATGRQSLASPTAGVGAKNFCMVLSTQASKLDTAIAHESSKLTSQFTARNSKIVANRASSDTTLNQNRAKWAKDRQAVYTRLTNKATTDAEKQAVLAFQNSIESAVTAREAAVDAARATYRQGIDAILASRSTSVGTILSTFKSAIETAVVQAQSSCAASTTPATARETFQAAVKTARDTRQLSIKDLDKVGEQVKTLAEVRNASIQQALATYQAAHQTAVAALKTEFGNPVPTATTTPLTTGTTTHQ